MLENHHLLSLTALLILKNLMKLVGGESNERHLEMLIDVLASGTFLNAVSQYKAVTMSNSSIQIQGSLRNFM